MILIIDGMNFLHRARSGFQLGDHNVVFNTFRNLKALVEQFKPTRVLMAMEGHPKRRHELLPSYKANRDIDVTTETGEAKYKSREDFYRQADVVICMLSQCFPISLMQHPDHEADDLIHNVIKNASSSSDFVIVSSDTDFIQSLQRFSNVQLYNPITKAFVTPPPYDYVFWKALRGDGSDNVPKVPGVNDDKAASLLEDPDALSALLQEHGAVFARNVELIRFMDFDDEELTQVKASTPQCDWDGVRAAFDTMGFKSMLKDTYWNKFQATFDALWK